MNAVLSYTPNVALNLADFWYANQIRAYRLDGKQQVFTSMMVAQRTMVLETQFVQQGYKNYGIANIVNLIAIARLMVPMMVIPLVNMCSRNAAKYVVRVWTPIQIGIDKVLNVISPLFDIVCVISYVALIALGHPVVGALGLAMLLIVQIKQRGYLPKVIDQVITPLTLISQMYVNVIGSTFVVLKVLAFAISFFTTWDYAVRNETLSSWLRAIGCPGTGEVGKHKIRQDAIALYPGDRAFMQMPFKVNPTHVHAKEVKEILPEQNLELIRKLGTEGVFTEIEKRYQEIKGTSIRNDSGWENIRRSTINGTCPDNTPVNFYKSVRIMKGILCRIHDEPEPGEFVKLAEELAKTGRSCAEGWIREVSFLLNPKSKDPRWVIHHRLGELRGKLVTFPLSVIDVKLREVLQDNHAQLPPGVDSAFDFTGGVNNVHLRNQLQAALWHRWRTNEGEVYMQVEGNGLASRLLQKGGSLDDDLLAQTVKKMEGGICDAITGWCRLMKESILTSIHVVLPVAIPPLYLTGFMHEYARAKYTAERMAEEIRKATEPEIYTLAEDKEEERDQTGKVIQWKQKESTRVIRDIDWDVITKCLEEIEKKAKEAGVNLTILDENTYEYNPTFVRKIQIDKGERRVVRNADYEITDENWISQERVDLFCLTNEGAKLLLWYMGIIEHGEALPIHSDLVNLLER